MSIESSLHERGMTDAGFIVALILCCLPAILLIASDAGAFR